MKKQIAILCPFILLALGLITFLPAQQNQNNFPGTGAGTGTVTHSAGALTLNCVVVGNGSADLKCSANTVDDGTTFSTSNTGGILASAGPVASGANGGVAGVMKLFGSTSGSIAHTANATGTADILGGQLTWPTGLGGINQLQGPTDQDFSLIAGTGRNFTLVTTADVRLSPGGGAKWAAVSGGPFEPFTDNANPIGAVGNIPSAVNGYQFAVPLTATAALTAGQVVKIDTANSNAVVVAATTDTGPGIPVGIVANSPGAAGTALVVTSGRIATPLLGTGTCSIGQFVIVDTTTGGRVQCTGTYTAGTVIGKAITAQAVVGSAVAVMVGLR